jgi:hypothetical protein
MTDYMIAKSLWNHEKITEESNKRVREDSEMFFQNFPLHANHAPWHKVSMASCEDVSIQVVPFLYLYVPCH